MFSSDYRQAEEQYERLVSAFEGHRDKLDKEIQAYEDARSRALVIVTEAQKLLGAVSDKPLVIVEELERIFIEVDEVSMGDVQRKKSLQKLRDNLFTATAANLTYAVVSSNSSSNATRKVGPIEFDPLSIAVSALIVAAGRLAYDEFSSWRNLPRLQDDIVRLLQESERVLLLTRRLEVAQSELSTIEGAVLRLLGRQKDTPVRSYRDMDVVERRWLSPLALSMLLSREVDVPHASASAGRADADAVIERAANRSLEQAQASWIDWLAQVRLAKLVEALGRQDLRLEDALEQLDTCRERIATEVIGRGAGRGGPHGAKGFIAERLDVYIENARSAIKGAEKAYRLTDDNGAIDYVRSANDVLTGIQQKFDMRRFGVEAIKAAYPEFVKQGGVYRIPADFYAELKRLSSVPEGEMRSLRLAQRNIIDELRKLEAEGIKLVSTIEPTSFEHMDAYQEKYAKTLAREREGILEEDRAARLEANE